MYYSFYQKKTFAYFFQKIKIGKFKKEKNDIQKRNLKGEIKSYQIFEIKDNTNVLIEKLEFNEDGYMIEQKLKFERKEFEYNKNLKLNKCMTYNNENKVVSIKYFDYNNNSRLIKKSAYYNNEVNKENYIEFYEYDLRNNITAIIRQYKFDDDILTLKYDENSKNSHIYKFNNSQYSNRLSIEEKNIHPFKLKITTHYSNENDIFLDFKELYNEKGDIMLSASIGGYTKHSFDKYITSHYFYNYDKFENWIRKKKYLSGDLIEELEAHIEYY